MGTLRDAMGYPLLRAGLIMLILALLISVAGFYRVNESYSTSGTLGEGMHYLGDDKFESEYLYHNRTLILSSSGANLSLIQGTKITNYTLANREITLHPEERPVIYVFNGSVNYTYGATAVDYPYAVYSLLAFVLMLVGIVISFIGYTQFLRDVKEGKK
ncbi:hypothetical protein A3L14_00815 [Thermococcus thioreducens]|uniref:Uncharacterized protein n=1 Tax=Thermococcus thioreducens TaxID=277988 RepID=A0A2Z2MS24_9EURY|nr:hypothetical protein [Thermococcus thioreducens]ASJ11517.1 hypothetical protein A3L14_00815 [Thermococcus thioreducens]